MAPLWKTTIVIWTEYDPQGASLKTLADEADQGDAYCAKSESVHVTDPAADPDWDGTDFFGVDEEDE